MAVDNQGDGAVVAGGDVAGSVIISGSNNTVYVGGPPPSTAPEPHPNPLLGKEREPEADGRAPTIFISYSHEDDAFVTRLIMSLNAAGHSVWIDRSDIKGGDDWLRAIPKGIADSHAFILVATKHSLASHWVRDEMAWAKKQRGKHIVPVLVEDVVDDPDFFPFVRIQGVTFYGADYDTAFARLLAALPPAAAPPPTAPPSAVPAKRRSEGGTPVALDGRAAEKRPPGDSISAASDIRHPVKRPAGKRPIRGAMPASQTTRRAAGGTPVALDGRVWVAMFVALIALSTVVVYHVTHSRVPSSPPPPTAKVNPVDGASMVYVPAGTFTMGNNNPPSQVFDNEKPARRVYLDGYYIYKNDVTVAEYKKFCDATGSKMPDAPSWGWNDTDYPMVNVSWDDAQAYAKWAGASLPTEAQWEKAARGTDGRTYPWGNEWDPTKCRCSRAAFGDARTPAAVGSYPAGASPYGVLDMAGNVWQWCSDWYGTDYYANSPSSNPTGPAGGTDRVVRGGGWIDDDGGEGIFRCAYRGGLHPEYRYGNLGFRCVLRPGSP